MAQSARKKRSAPTRKAGKGASTRRSSDPRHLLAAGSSSLAPPPPPPIERSAALLADMRLQWSLGDWNTLASLPLEAIEQLPDRAELALLSSCAHLQRGDKAAARRYLAAASRWHCSPELILQGLSSVVQDTMATYQLRKGDTGKAMAYLTSTAEAFGGASASLAARARMALTTNDPGIDSDLTAKSLARSTNTQRTRRAETGKYDLSHLTQFRDQHVIGPIQDDEALFLYALIKGMKISTVLELGGLEGYSAKNFLNAIGSAGVLFTCDTNPVASQAPNHRIITKDCATIDLDDLDQMRVELVFFDCHEYGAQMSCYHSLRQLDLIDDRTILALHDTNTHPCRHVDWAYPVEAGYIHQATERRMVNAFVELGYHAFCLHTSSEKHSPAFPFRHGLTLMQKWTPFAV